MIYGSANEWNNAKNKKVLLFGYFVSFKGIDKGIVEIFGPYGIATTFSSLASRAFSDGFKDSGGM